MTVSYIGLMQAQQKRHEPVAALPVARTEAEMHADARERRARLMGSCAGRSRLAPITALPEPEAAPAPSRPTVAVPEPSEAPAGFGVPIDMLQPPSWQFLMRLAVLRHGVSESRIKGDERVRQVYAAREEVAVLVYQHTQASLTVIGRLLNRHHTTVLSCLRKRGVTEKLVELKPAIAMERSNKPLKPIEMALQARRSRSGDTREIIKEEYAKGTPLREIAEIAGITHGSVKVIAKQMGFVHPRGMRAINLVPEHQRDDFRNMVVRKRIGAMKAIAILNGCDPSEGRGQ